MTRLSTPVVYAPPLPEPVEGQPLHMGPDVVQAISLPIANQSTDEQIIRGKFLRCNQRGGLAVEPARDVDATISTVTYSMETVNAGAVRLFQFITARNYVQIKWGRVLMATEGLWVSPSGVTLVSMPETVYNTYRFEGTKVYIKAGAGGPIHISMRLIGFD